MREMIVLAALAVVLGACAQRPLSRGGTFEPLPESDARTESGGPASEPAARPGLGPDSRPGSEIMAPADTPDGQDVPELLRPRRDKSITI